MWAHVANWVRMQDEYECFFCVVDWHALTTDYGRYVSGETKLGGSGAGLAGQRDSTRKGQ